MFSEAYWGVWSCEDLDHPERLYDVPKFREMAPTSSVRVIPDNFPDPRPPKPQPKDPIRIPSQEEIEMFLKKEKEAKEAEEYEIARENHEKLSELYLSIAPRIENLDTFLEKFYQALRREYHEYRFTSQEGRVFEIRHEGQVDPNLNRLKDTAHRQVRIDTQCIRVWLAECMFREIILLKMISILPEPLDMGHKEFVDGLFLHLAKDKRKNLYPLARVLPRS